MRLVYLGTPEMAVPPLEALVEAGHEVDDVLAVGADLGVVVAFGQLIRPHVLAELEFVNLHFSLLPRWRGAAPVERALLAGDRETGVCVMQLEEGLDTGPVYSRARIPIGPTTTADELRSHLVRTGAKILVDTLGGPMPTAVAQVGEPSYAQKIDPDELRIDWSSPAEQIDRLIRVGGAWTTFRGRRVKILAAQLVDGRVEPETVQPEGKAPMPYEAWRNGAQPAVDEWFE